MSAADERFEARAHRFIPDMAKEVIFWCAVFTAVVTGGVLISQMGPSWPVSVPPAQSAPMTASNPEAAGEEPSTVPSAFEALIHNASEPAEQPPTF